MWSIFNDRNTQCIMISQISLLLKSPSKAFDLLDIIDFENRSVQRSRFEDKGNQDSPLGMSVDAASRIALRESCNEQRSTL